MKPRVLHGLAIGAFMAFAASAGAAEFNFHDIRGNDKDGAEGYVDLTPTATIGGILQNGETQPRAAQQRKTMTDFQFAQADDASYRVNQLEEQVRELTGQIEDLKFQILQMQEMVRKMQEETDFRLQELEEAGGKQGALETGDDASKVASDQTKPAEGDDSLGKSSPSELQSGNAGSDGTTETAALGDQNSPEAGKSGTLTPQDNSSGGHTLDGVEIYNPAKDAAKSSDQSAALAEKPLGTLTFDENGNVVDTAIGKPLDLNAGINQSDGGQSDSGQLPTSPDELYNLGYSFIEAGNYVEAQKAFGRFVEEFPSDERVAQANYWLGESYFSQRDYQEAAKVFLENHKKWPKSSLGAQNMLKLGLSLAGLNQRQMACTTYAEIAKQYPDMSGAIKQQVLAEQQSAKCVSN